MKILHGDPKRPRPALFFLVFLGAMLIAGGVLIELVNS